MSRLLSYINEEDNEPDRIIRLLKTDCKPFLKEYTGRFLYRGSSNTYGDIEKVIPKKNRRPLDTPLELHNIWNNAFKKKFGWNVRSEGVFVTGDDFQAGEFGAYVYLVFPIGEFKYVWSSKYKDISADTSTDNDEISIYEYFLDRKHKHEMEIKKIWFKENRFKTFNRQEFDEWKKKREADIHKDIVMRTEDMINSFTDRNFKKAIKSGNEISIKCDAYYMVSIEYNRELEKVL
jgi:hypothetical protein